MTQEVRSGSTGTHRSGYEIAALCAGNAISTCGGFVVPLWVAVFIRSKFLPELQVGWLASAYLIVLAAAGIASSTRAVPANSRPIASGLALAICIGNALAAIPKPAAVAAGLCVSAIAMGVLHSFMIRAGAHTVNAPRVLALMTAAAMALGGITNLGAPHLISGFNASGLFLLLSAYGALCAIVLGFVTVNSPPGSPDRKQAFARGSSGHGVFIALAASALVNMALTTVSTYSLVIGTRLGFSVAESGAALGISEPVSLVGALMAHQLGDRLGLLRPILGALVLMTVAEFALVTATSSQLFVAALLVASVTFAFYIPYAMAHVGRLDRSGRLVGAFPGLVTIGSAVGPALGGHILTRFPFQVLAFVAGGLFSISGILFCVSPRIHARTGSLSG